MGRLIRSVSVSVGANTSNFVAGMARGERAAKQFATTTQQSVGKALTSIDNSSQHYDRISSGLTKVGAVGAVGLGLVAKAAIDWESAWAGVTKTVDGTAPQMAALEGELRGLARTLPSTHKEIAAVAEAAGQLGVKRDSITAFTRTMIDLGETTNLSADEAATSIAQLMNVMGTAPQSVGRLGATLVALGNAGASTERDIIQMAQRIAGAGKQVGLTEGEVLAFSNALASVGIDAEAGGTAISTSFLKIDQAVRSGGEELNLLARTAGMTGTEFKTAFQKDAAGATNAFIQGLGKVQAAGGDTTKILKDLGIVGIRESDALRRLASSGGLLSDSLKLQDEAWRSNSALVEEAAKRYATTEAQAKIAWNQIKDSAISAGQSMLPVLSQIATVVGDLAQWFGEIPEPVRIAGVALAGTTTIMAFGGAAALKAVTGLAALRTAYHGAGLAATTAGRAMKIAQLAIPGVGIALFAATTAMQLFAGKTTDGETVANGFAEAMHSVEGAVTRSTAALNENVRAAAIQALQQQGAFESAKALGLGLGTVTDAALGNRDAIAEVNAALNTNLSLNPQVSQANSDAYNAALALSQSLGGVARQSIQAVAAENERRAAMDGSTAASNRAKAASVELTRAQADLQGAQKRLREETQKVIDKYTILREGSLNVEQATIAWEGAIDALSDSVETNGRSLDRNTAKGRANRTAVIDAIRAMNEKSTADFKATEKSKGLSAATDEASKRLQTNRARLIEAGRAAGMNKTEVKKMVDQMLRTPEELRTRVKTEGAGKARAEVDDLRERIKDIEGKEVTVRVKFSAGRVVLSERSKGGGRNTAGGMTSFDVGGYTGNYPADQIVGVVHGDEEVIKSPSRRKFEKKFPGYLKHINDEGDLPGYQNGGTVTRDVRARFAAGRQPAFLPHLNSLMGSGVTASLAKAQDVLQASMEVAGAFGRIDVGNPRGRTQFRGHTFTNLFAASLRAAEQDAGTAFSIFQGGFRPSTSYSGTSHQGDAVDFQVNRALIAAARRHGIAAWDRTGKGNWVPHSHGVPLPGAGFGGGSAVWQAQDYLRGGDGLVAGGIVKGGQGGVMTRVGEGRFDELVTPLPQGWDLSKPRNIVDRNYVQGHRYASPGYAQSGGGSLDQSLSIQVMGDVIDPDQILRRADVRRRDALTMRGISGRRV